jgi:hypothetical protein
VVFKKGLEDAGITVPAWLNRWAYLASLSPAEKAFNSVYRGLRWLGLKASPAQTPAEAAAALSTRIPELSPDIRTLLEQCERSFYSQKKVDLEEARQASEAIRRAALKAGVQARIKAFGVLLKQGFRPRQPGDVP